MAQSAINSLGQAEEIIKEMKGKDVDFGEYYRGATREALRRILEEQMASSIDRRLAEIARRGGTDRRNGHFSRHLLTELGDIELAIPRTRTGSAVQVVRAYARRVRQVDRMILACFVLGLSTRKVAHALLPILGEMVSPSLVSRVAKTLDGAVTAFHARPLKNRYRFLLFDGVVLKRKTGGGAIKRVVLVAMGITPEGKKEVIDFFIASGESQQAWEAFLNDLFRRGLDGEGLELIVTDGGAGMLAALGLVFPRIPHQRCWAHKTRNVINAVRKADQKEVKKDLHPISHAKNRIQALSAFKAFSQRWAEIYPKAVKKIRENIDSLLAFLSIPEPELWAQIRTTNAIERRFVEVRRRTRPMGVFADKTSMERILFAVFTYENRRQGTGTPFLALTQNS
jgi:putative transposase